MAKDGGIDLVFDSRYRNLRDEFAKKYFDDSYDKAGLFALALGIRTNSRVPKDGWKGDKSGKKSLSWTDMKRLTGDGIDFSVIFDYMDIDDGGMSTKQRLDEFVTGGWKIIEQNDILEDGCLMELPNLLKSK